MLFQRDREAKLNQVGGILDSTLNMKPLSNSMSIFTYYSNHKLSLLSLIDWSLIPVQDYQFTCHTHTHPHTYTCTRSSCAHTHSHTHTHTLLLHVSVCMFPELSNLNPRPHKCNILNRVLKRAREYEHEPIVMPSTCHKTLKLTGQLHSPPWPYCPISCQVAITTTGM